MRHPKSWAAAAALTVGLMAAVFAFVGPARTETPDLTLTPDHEACTVLMVGKGASTDGSTMTTHTCDCGTCDWTWGHVPAKDHKTGEVRKIWHINQYTTWAEGTKWTLAATKGDTGFAIPEISHTYAYHHGMFGYMNENQVAISESTLGTVRKLVNNTPAAKIDLTMLSLLGMERSKTARECIATMGALAEKYGYGFNDDGEMFAVSDPNEVWIFEIMPVGPLWTPESGKPGAVWCAQRVPDDHVSVCPNESRIGEIKLEDKDFFMASSNVVSCAIENKLYDPASGKPFSWKHAYSPANASALSSNGGRQRLWRFLDGCAPSLKINPNTPNMDLPFSVKPDKKLSAQDVMNWTRDKSYGTIFDPVQGIRGGPFQNPNYYSATRKISVANVEYTSLVQCRPGLPNEIGGIIWLSFGPQDTAIYMPLYAGMNAVPKSFTVGDHFVFNRASARWASDYVDFHTQVVYNQAIKDVQKAQLELEGGAIQKIPEIDKAALALYAKSPAKAREYLTKTAIELADRMVAGWWDLGDKLLVKYIHLGYYNVEKRTRDRVNAFVPQWNKAVRMVDTWLEPEPAPGGRR
ncbi:MAG: C69 family dipeptidase [Candidatus Aminicenantes bacterium]|nr:C69 family dipeptidase [Candidatus Aminicenantes bacterium]